MESNSLHPTLYEILGVDMDSDVETIRQSWRSLVRSCVSEQMPLATNKEFKKITDAWLILCDKQKRAAFDRSVLNQDKI
jgi:curved DNA-binding protein CbpA